MPERTRIYRALTICQPYAHLIATPDEQLPMGYVQKRAENRSWFCAYRGPLAIHAGKGTKYLEEGDRERFPGMVFGAVVAIAEMVACVHYGARHRGKSLPDEYKWIEDHPHAEGPYCFILERVRPLALPYYTRGAQGLWNVDIPEELLPERA